jgi:alkylation response protein AidB-like acyl-CoA dehydrogenase
MFTSASSSAKRSAIPARAGQGRGYVCRSSIPAKRLCLRCRKACDRGETTREDAAGAILYAAENATKMALDAIQLLGGNGYINEYATGRLLRDAKLYEIGAGTSEIRPAC